MEVGWHYKFDTGLWALVPDQETLDDIIKKLKEVEQKHRNVAPEMSEGLLLEKGGGQSAWPHFNDVSKAINMLIAHPHSSSTGFLPQGSVLPVSIRQRWPPWKRPNDYLGRTRPAENG